MDTLYISFLILSTFIGVSLFLAALGHITLTFKEFGNPKDALKFNIAILSANLFLFLGVLLLVQSGIQSVFGESWYSNGRVLMFLSSAYLIPVSALQVGVSKIIHTTLSKRNSNIVVLPSQDPLTSEVA